MLRFEGNPFVHKTKLCRDCMPGAQWHALSADDWKKWDALFSDAKALSLEPRRLADSSVQLPPAHSHLMRLTWQRLILKALRLPTVFTWFSSMIFTRGVRRHQQ
jgi:hypothetical protein